jgi:hypothetical protein
VTAERKRERDAMDRGKVVPEHQNGIEDGFHVLTLLVRRTTAHDPPSLHAAAMRAPSSP